MNRFIERSCPKVSDLERANVGGIMKLAEREKYWEEEVVADQAS